ncbi:wax ester/triacylglycerol synthase domain-containing protein [Nocardia rhizosphaerae]|uniref:diacylglycerol O-acyltransferase n=1 Tax=Nocardia rhizosphaerae TaxID=1691571 RepID=A0ABV8L9H4_9NOCA
MSNLDTLMLYRDRRGAQRQIVYVGLYEPHPSKSIDEVVELLVDRLTTLSGEIPILTRRPVTPLSGVGHAYWQDVTDWSPVVGVGRGRVPAPGGWTELCDYVAGLHTQEIPLTGPLWRLDVVTGLDNIDGIPPGGFAVVFRVHHAAVDGGFGLEILKRLHDGARPERGLMGSPTPRSDSEHGRAREDFRSLIRELRTMGRGLAGALKILAGGGMSGTTVECTAMNSSVTHERAVRVCRFSYQDIRAVRRAVPGATVNDVFLAVVGAGMDGYLSGRTNEHTDIRALTTCMPVSIAQGCTADPLDGMSSANQFAIRFVSLGEPDSRPLDRLASIRNWTVEAKSTVKFGSGDGHDLLPGPLEWNYRLNAWAAARVGHVLGGHTVTTNVPGPRDKISLDGCECVRLFGFAPIYDGVGVVHTMSSYGDDVSLAILADPTIIDIEEYAVSIQQAFSDLADATADVGAGQAGRQ